METIHISSPWHGSLLVARAVMLVGCALGGITNSASETAAAESDLPPIQDFRKLSDIDLGLAFLKAREVLSAMGRGGDRREIPARNFMASAKIELGRRGAAQIASIYDGIVSPACPRDAFSSGFAKIEQHDAEIEITRNGSLLPGVVVKDTVLVIIPELEVLIGKISEGNITLIASSGDCSMSFATAVNLHDAVRADDIAKVQSFISSGADVNQSDSWGTPLDIAISKGADEIAGLLINAGADVEGATSLGTGGEHPLHLAAARLHGAATARLLIEHGARLEAFDSAGKTPLIVAVMANNFDVADVLIAAGADLEGVDGTYHESPLNWAAKWGRLEAAKLLVSRGARINGKAGFDGNTPLHNAAVKGRLEMMDYLLRSGADVNARNTKGQTPLKGTRVKGAQELLRSLGALE